MPIQSKEEIIVALNEKVDAFISHISALNSQQFEMTPNEKWSAGQNLDHLIRSIQPLQLAYSLPKFMLKLLFGKANRPSKTYEELVAKYKAKLAAGGRASRRFVPPIIYADKKTTLLSTYQKQKQKLISKIKNTNEKDLDLYILPHPLLGKITLREMLFFTIYHNEHHLEILRSREGVGVNVL